MCCAVDMITIKVKVTARSSSNKVLATMPDGTLKVKLTAPPVDNKANDALIQLLAETYAVPDSWVRIVKGHTSNIKMVEIDE